MSTRNEVGAQISRRLILAAIEDANELLTEIKQGVKDRIPFEGIARRLPFPTEIVAGYNHNHIRSLYAFDIETGKRTITEGETLCGRKSSQYYRSVDSNCPGCSAIGENLALRNPITARSIELLAPAISTRNRHTVANDVKTALIKRINRAMQKYGIDWKVKVNREGRSYVYSTVSNGLVTYYDNLNELAAMWGVTNATAGCDITLTNATAGSPSYSSHY